MTQQSSTPGPIRGSSSGATARIRSALALAASLAFGPAPAAAETALDGLSVSVKRARTVCFADRVEVTGVLVPRQEIDVGVEREGLKVVQVLAEPRDTVAAGQVLANLAPLDGAPNGSGTASVRSPVAGTVLRSSARIGSPVSPRQEALFQIAPRGEVDLKADVALADLSKLAIRQVVTVKPLGLAEVSGKVRHVDLTLDPASQLGRARIALDAAAGEMRIGTFARGVIALGERCGIGVPYSAIQYESDGTIVHTVEDDRIVTRPVTIGLLSGTDIEIRSGLTDVDRVVVRAGAFLRDGDRVHPILTRDTAGAADQR